jgi:hypothetical protein
MKELFDNYVENAFGEFKQAEFKFENLLLIIKNFPEK